MLARRFSSCRGQGAAEFAVLLPLLALLLAGVVDVGRGFHARVVLANAVREGARHGAGRPTDDVGIKDAVLGELATTSIRKIPRSSITISRPDGTDAKDPITVSAKHDFDTLMGAVLGIKTVPISASVKMMILSGA